jgi:hypothetical protein
VSNEHRRWREISLERRFEALHSKPRAEPAAPVSLASTVHGVTFSADEVEQQAANGRRARALIEIETALRKEAEAADTARRAQIDHVKHDTALGALVFRR